MPILVKSIAVVASLMGVFIVGELYDARARGPLLLVRSPQDVNLCAAEDQDTGRIVGVWKPAAGRCSMTRFLWRRALFLPDEVNS